MGQFFLQQKNFSLNYIILENYPLPPTPYPLYCSYLKFSDLKASKPAVRKLGRRR
ncbi:MAG: hypothetical protein LBP59_11380 [Planctomycetaceae bacterium]|nr:hypothetical protein [Planctomycetaceae bacterium]